MPDISPAVFASQADGLPLPKAKLIVCATPRTASNSLMRLLTAAGIGNPAEYFHRKQAAALAAAWNIAAPGSNAPSTAIYLDLLMRRTQANGVFATKLFFPHFRGFLLNASGLDLFRDAAVVFLLRANLAEQAVSCLVAHEMSHWGGGEAELPADSGSTSGPALRGMIDHLANQERSWRQFFAYAGIDPVILTDADVTERPVATVEALASRLGLIPDSAALAACAARVSKYTPGSGRKQQLIAEELPKLAALAFQRDTWLPDKPRRKRTGPAGRLLGLLGLG